MAFWNTKHIKPYDYEAEEIKETNEEVEVSVNNKIKGMEKLVMETKNELGIAVCPICGKQFVKYHTKQKYCSDECRVQAQREAHARYARKRTANGGEKVKMHNYTCVNCGRGFRGRHGQKTCSEKCRIEQRRKAQREWYANQVAKQGKTVTPRPSQQKPTTVAKPQVVEPVVEKKQVVVNEKPVEMVVTTADKMQKAYDIVLAIENSKDKTFIEKMAQVMEML